MNPWPFVIASYGITTFATVALVLWSYVSMRRAERDAEAVTRRR